MSKKTAATAEEPSSPANNSPRRYFATVRVDQIHSFPLNYRKFFDATKLKELGESILVDGVIEPVILRKVETVNGIAAGYEGIAGERRCRAAVLVGVEELPAVVFEGISTQQAIRIALVENLQRADVNPIEEAEGFRMLAEVSGMKQKDIASQCGRPRSTVANTMRLLDLPESAQEHIRSGALTKAHGMALLRFRGHDQVIEKLASLAIEGNIPAGELEDGLPCSHVLAKTELVFFFYNYQYDPHWCPARAAVLDEYRTKFPHEILEGEGSYFYTFNKALASEIKSKADEAEAAARVATKETGDSDADGDGEEEPDPEEQKRLQELQARAAKANGRLEKWLKKWNDPKKGPTVGSPLYEFKDLLHLILLQDECAVEGCYHISLEEKRYFGIPEDIDLSDDDQAESLLKILAQMPINSLLHYLLYTIIERVDSRPSEYQLKALERQIDILEGKGFK